MAGIGVPPDQGILRVSPNRVLIVATAGGERQVSRIDLVNTGKTRVRILETNLSGTDPENELIVANKCPRVLEPRQRCYIEVSLYPKEDEAWGRKYNATLTISDDAFGSPHIVQVTGVRESMEAISPSRVKVPDLRGKTVHDAELLLFQSRGGLSMVTDRPADPNDLVAEQSPAPGTQVAYGTVINFRVGQVAVSAVTVPDVRGRRFTDAAVILRKSGLFITSTTSVGAIEISGIVRNQSPAPGTRVAPRSIISVQLVVLIPNVIGKKQPEAEAALKDLGLKVAVSLQLAGGLAGPDAGTVVSQSPKGGTTVDLASTVRLTVRK